MTRLAALLALALAWGCAVPDAPGPVIPTAPAPLAASPLVVVDAALATPLPIDPADPGEPAPLEPEAEEPAEVAPVADPEVWLRGSTHVHARPSGDSSEPIAKVIEWYERHGYDFIVLTDHNRVTEVDTDTTGKVAARAPAKGLIVLAGIELTHNPMGCLPAGDRSRKCRIHVNALGVTARPGGKLEWAERKSHERVDMYQAAINASHALGTGIMQINHPQWFWGMTPDVLVEIAHRGVQLVEVTNVQFAKWNAGDADHPSTEVLWDAALARGATLWGVASDDAHDYEGRHRTYPAGGGWVVVKARRDPQAILDALGAGHFYSSTGVTLARAEVEAGELVVEVAPAEAGQYSIAWIENGKTIDTIAARSARRAVPQSGYVRAVVTRDDGTRAWVQPARR